MELFEDDLLPPPPPKSEILNNIQLLPFPPKKVILGGEYINLATPRKPTKKQKGKIDHTIDRLNEKADDEAKFVFEGGSGIYLPTFKEYANTFLDIIKDETKIKADFDAFKDTSIFERYQLNAVQFSSAKSVAVNKLMKEELFDSDSVRKGYSAFKRDVKEVTNIVNDTWLRTEYDTAVRQAVAGQQFISYRENTDIYPYWVYLETTSEHPREEHLVLVGNIYRIGDPEGDEIFPPNGFNCSCGSEQIDDQYLDENNKSVRTNSEAKEDLENGVPEQFRFNPADQGILPKEGHSYFMALPNANEAYGDLFNIE